MTDGIPNHIMPQSDYNPVEAKFCASLFWLVFHATEDGDFDNIPAEITCPTERNEEAGFFVRSPVVSFLCDGTIYMKVASQLLNSDSEIVSFWDVIQLLANAGFYVIDFNDEAVTEERLAEQAPFSMESHLALMDTLIVAFVNSSVTIQQIVDAVRRFGTFNPSKEQPFDYEDAFLLWLNKISTTNNITVAKRKQSAVTDAVSGTNAEPSRRFRFKRDQVIERAPKVFPKLDDFQRDIADGKSLLSLIVFYCPDALDIDHIKLSGKLNDEEIITNVDLFRELCAQHICTSIFALRTEDIVYKYAELKNNILALFCEMFLEVEVERRDQGREGVELGSDVAVGEDWKANEASTVAKGRSEIVENSSNANRQNESRFPDSADTNTWFYIRKQQETTEKVKQRTGVKPGYASGDEIDMSIEDKLQRLKMFSAGGSKVAESLDSLPPRPTPSTAKAATKSRQPLLSKRSKKQLANIGDGKKSLSNEDLSGLELEDFDLKRSHSLSSVTERANYAIDPKRSIRAWEGGTGSPDTSRNQKSQKISLDFKPDAAPYRPHRSSDLYTMEDHTSSHLNVENRSWRQQDNQDNEYRLEDYDSESTKQEEALASPRDGERLAGDSFALSTNSRHATARGGGSIEGSLHNHRTTRADDVRESAGSTSSEEMRRFRDEIRATSHGEIYEGEERVDNGAELEAGFVEPQLEDDDMFGFGGFKKPMQPPMQQSICNYGVSPRPNRIMVNSSSGTFAKGLHGDHDDELSTIAESSEPSTPTVYSFESRLSTEDDSRNSLLDTSEEAVTVSDTGESTLTSHAFVSPTPSGNEGASLGVSSSAKMTSLNRVLSPNYQRNLHLAAKPPALPRSSYTILNTDLSLDSAIAAGLPIIEDEEKAAEFTDGTPYFEHTSAQDLDPNLEQELGRVNGNLGSEHGSDADDVQIHLPAISRSSSSGISADGVREEEAAISEEEADGRPGIAVYSSLSEHTAGGSSPTNLDGARHVQHVEDAVGDGDGGEEEATPLRDQAGAATDVNMQESRKDVEEDEVDAAGNVPVKRSTFLSLDFDEDEQMSTSALAVCLEPVEAEKRPAEEKQQNSSPTRSRHSWSYMEVEVKKENPSNIFGNSDQRNADQDTSSSTTPSRSNHTIESMPNRQLNRDKKATTSWQQISRDDGSSFLQGIKKPHKDLTHCLTKVEDGPVMNWAEYAKLKNVDTSESEDESAGRSPREPLAPRLAILKMQLEERRRHIEEEKKRMVEQWNEERARVGQQAFWFAVGNKDSKTEGGEQDSNAKESGADSTKKPGLMFFPFSDDNDPKTLHKKSPPTRPESPPNECSTPVTRAAPRSKQERFPSHEGNYTVHDNRIDSQDSNYTVNFNRIGSQTILESSTVNEQGITYVVERHEDGSIVTVDDKGDQVFYEDYASIPTFVKRALTCGSSDALASGKHQSPRRNDSRKQARPENPARQQAEDTEHHENLVHQPGRHSHRTAWNDPVKLSTRDFPPSVIKGMESADVKSESLVPESETHFYYEESLGNVYRRSSDEGLADHLLHDRRAMKLVSEELQSEPAAREIGGDRGLRYPADQALSPDSWDDASERRGAPIHQTPDQLTEVGLSKDQATPRTGEDHSRHKFKEPQDGHDEYAIAADVSHVEETTPRKISPRDDAMRNTGVEIESPAELTPDQLKKRERFLQNRVKRQQEEKAKKEAELEKRKRKEEKMRERKAASEKKEREDQRKRKLKEEEEARRRHEEGARRRHEEETRRRRHGEDEEEQRRQGDEQPWRLGRNYPTGEDERPAQHHKTPRSHFSGNNNGSHGNIRQATNEAFNQASPTQWTLTEYRGPPVYVKPSGKSNRQIMFNAITHCCLSGEVNKEAKEKFLQVLSQSNATHFFALFREGLKFRGLYSYPHEEDEAHKIYGVGPKIISNQMVEKLFKYSSGGKSFSQIPAKSLSIQVDGITIKKGCWQSSKATSLPSKTDSNLKKGQTSYASRSEMLKKGSPKAARR